MLYDDVTKALVEILRECITDARKFDMGNDAAGIRLRKGLAEVRDQAQRLRKEVLTARKTRRK